MDNALCFRGNGTTVRNFQRRPLVSQTNTRLPLRPVAHIEGISLSSRPKWVSLIMGEPQFGVSFLLFTLKHISTPSKKEGIPFSHGLPLVYLFTPSPSSKKKKTSTLKQMFDSREFPFVELRGGTSARCLLPQGDTKNVLAMASCGGRWGLVDVGFGEQKNKK